MCWKSKENSHFSSAEFFFKFLVSQLTLKSESGVVPVYELEFEKKTTEFEPQKFNRFFFTNEPKLKVAKK